MKFSMNSAVHLKHDTGSHISSCAVCAIVIRMHMQLCIPKMRSTMLEAMVHAQVWTLPLVHTTTRTVLRQTQEPAVCGRALSRVRGECARRAHARSST